MEETKKESAKPTPNSEEIVYIQSFNYPWHRIRHQNNHGIISELETELDFQDAAWKIVPGLADASWISFESTNYPGYYLRHCNYAILLGIDDGSTLSQKDATFRIIPGLANKDWISFESYNYPGHYIRHCGFQLYISKSDGSELFFLDCTFKRSNKAEKKAVTKLVTLSLNGKSDLMISHKNQRCHISNLNEADQIYGIWRMVPGLANSEHVSFESYANAGYYLRHRYFELWADKIGGIELNKEDATFKIVAGLDDSSLVSFESVNFPGYFIHHQEGKIFLHKADANSGFNQDATFKISDTSTPSRVVTIKSLNYPKFNVRHSNSRVRISVLYDEDEVTNATWKLVPGLADPTWISFESVDFPGHYLRHRNYECWVDKYDGSELNRKDATFREVPGLANSEWTSFESYNYPGHYIRHCGYELYIHTSDNSELFRNDATFLLQDPGVITEEVAVDIADATFLESFNYRDHFIRHHNSRVVIRVFTKETELRFGGWKIVAGLADPSWISFESVDFPRHYLRHRNYEIWLDAYTDTDLYRKDATFKAVAGLANDGWTSFESYNYPKHYIRHCGWELYIHKSDGTELFRKDVTFRFKEAEPVKGSLAEIKYASLQSYNYPAFKLRHEGYRAKITQIGSELDFQDSTWKVRAGLADSSMVSFESVNYPGHYLRHRNYEFWLDKFEDSTLYCKDATFKVVPGLANKEKNWVSFESLNYPEHYIRHSIYLIYLAKYEDNELYLKDATWRM